MATLGNKNNIIVGAATLYMGNTGIGDPTKKPAFGPGSYRNTLDDGTDTTKWSPSEADGTSAKAWKPVGFTQEGLEISYEPDFGDVEVDQILDSALVFKQGMRVSLNTTLAEATLYNLMVAWGQSDSTLRSSGVDEEIDIAAGELGEAPVERPFIAVGNATRGVDGKYGERVYHAYRTLNVESSTHGMKRSENTGIPVSFRALPSDNGLYGKIKDRKKTW